MVGKPDGYVEVAAWMPEVWHTLEKARRQLAKEGSDA